MNVLAYFAHPDDETMLCGGTLALLARQGAQVTLLCATRGEGGETGEPPLCTREELGALREAELRCAAAALGLARVDLLDYVDPTVGPDNTLFPFCEDEETLARQVVDEYLRVEAQALFSHGSNGEYGHPAHRLCHHSVLRALDLLRAAGHHPLFYTAQAAYPEHPLPRLMNVDDPAYLLLDCTAVLPQKTQAALCHHTQHALFVRHATQELGRPVSVPEVILVRESLHRAYPSATAGEPLHDQLAGLLRASGSTQDLLPA